MPNTYSSILGTQRSYSPTEREGINEATNLLQPSPDEEIDHDGCFPPHGGTESHPDNPHAGLPVYITIHRIRRDVIAAIDDPYSMEQLRDPKMNMTVVRPLVDKFYDLNDVSIVYCLLVNRVQFQHEQTTQSHHQSVCITRALLCELIATRILRRFHEDSHGAQGLLLLAHVLVGGFDPFQEAPPEVLEQSDHHLSWAVRSRTGYKRQLPALEIAIISESKILLSSSACQVVVKAIYEGRVIYTPTSFIDILPDHYKNKPVSLYNPRKSPVLNQYRLIVPRTRNILEICQFIILLTLYLIVMAERDVPTFFGFEVVFIIFTSGFLLDMFATVLEHGWDVYTQNLWSFLDVTFAGIFCIYLTIRMHAWRTNNLILGQQAMDVLAIGAPVLVPRLAFNLMSENMLFVSLRAMVKDFLVLTILAVWCFAGFLLSMTWLSNGENQPIKHQPITISKWMLWVWFGLDGTGIQRSTEFHEYLGPILMISFAFLGNSLFLTILVSMLSATFASIVQNANAEIQFRRAILTLEGVKSDAIFSYLPPFNILALLILLPLKFVLTPRWFHKINVAAVRALNAPILLIIGLYERRNLWPVSRRPRNPEQLPKTPSAFRSRPWDLTRQFSAHGDIQAVFDAEPPQEIEDIISNDDDLNMPTLETAFMQEFGPGSGRQKTLPRKDRRDSVAPFGGLSKKVKDLIGDDGDSNDEDLEGRLAALEQSNARIERLLERLCAELDNEDKRSSDVGDEEDGAIDPLQDFGKGGENTSLN